MKYVTRRAIICDDKGKPIRDPLSRRVLFFGDIELAQKWAEETFGDTKTTFVEPLEPLSTAVVRQLNQQLRKEGK